MFRELRRIPVLGKVFEFIYVNIFGIYIQSIVIACGGDRTKFFKLHSKWNILGLTYLVTDPDEIFHKLQKSTKVSYIGGIPLFSLGLNPNTSIFHNKYNENGEEHPYQIPVTILRTIINNIQPLDRFILNEDIDVPRQIKEYVWKSLLQIMKLEDAFEDTKDDVIMYTKLVTFELMSLPANTILFFLPHIYINYLKSKIVDKLWSKWNSGNSQTEISKDQFMYIVQILLFAGINGTAHLANACYNNYIDNYRLKLNTITDTENNIHTFILESGQRDPPVTSSAVFDPVEDNIYTLCLTLGMMNSNQTIIDNLLWNGSDRHNHPRACIGKFLSKQIVTMVVKGFK